MKALFRQLKIRRENKDGWKRFTLEFRETVKAHPIGRPKIFEIDLSESQFLHMINTCLKNIEIQAVAENVENEKV